MKHLLITIVSVVVLSTSLNAQELISKQFYKSVESKKPTQEKKAKVICYNYKESDGVIKSEYRSKKSDKLVAIRRYKDGKPAGKWIRISESTGKQYEICYREKAFDDVLRYDGKNQVLLSDCSGKFTVPTIKGRNESILVSVAKRILMPVEAQQRGMHGEVIAQFIIDEQGCIQNISIKKGVHPLLDLSVVQAIQRLPKIEPATLDGKNVKVQMEVKSQFQIG